MGANTAGFVLQTEILTGKKRLLQYRMHSDRGVLILVNSFWS